MKLRYLTPYEALFSTGKSFASDRDGQIDNEIAMANLDLNKMCGDILQMIFLSNFLKWKATYFHFDFIELRY